MMRQSMDSIDREKEILKIQIKQLETMIKNRNEEISQLGEVRERLNQCLSETQKCLESKDRQIEQLNQQLLKERHQNEQIVQTLRNEISSLKENVYLQQATLKSKDEHIETLNQQLQCQNQILGESINQSNISLSRVNQSQIVPQDLPQQNDSHDNSLIFNFQQELIKSTTETSDENHSDDKEFNASQMKENWCKNVGTESENPKPNSDYSHLAISPESKQQFRKPRSMAGQKSGILIQGLNEQSYRYEFSQYNPAKQSNFILQQYQVIVSKMSEANKGYKRLIDGFMILGCRQQELKNKINNQTVKGYADTVILYEKYFKKDFITGDIKRKIAQLAYPLPIEFEIIDYQEAQEVALNCNEQLLLRQIFVIDLQTCESSEYQNHEYFEQFNPTQNCYGIVLPVKDFVKCDNKYVKFTKTLCFITQFPILELFAKLLVHMANFQKYTRIKHAERLMMLESGEQSSPMRRSMGDSLTLTDSEATIKECSKDFDEMLQQIYRLKITSDNYTIYLRLRLPDIKSDEKSNLHIKKLNKFHYTIPGTENIFNHNLTQFAQTTFTTLSPQDIKLIFLSQLFNLNIFFVASSKAILTKLIFFFSQLIDSLDLDLDLEVISICSIYNIEKKELKPRGSRDIIQLIGFNAKEQEFSKLCTQFLKLDPSYIIVFADKKYDSLQKSQNSKVVFGCENQAAKIMSLESLLDFKIPDCTKDQKQFIQCTQEQYYHIFFTAIKSFKQFTSSLTSKCLELNARLQKNQTQSFNYKAVKIHLDRKVNEAKKQEKACSDVESCLQVMMSENLRWLNNLRVPEERKKIEL